MANELIIIQQENLHLTIIGKRITAFPDTGAIITMEKTSPDGSVTGGLHKTATFVINGSDVYRLTINVMPHSGDDMLLNSVAEGIRKTGKVAPVVISYQGTKYVSGGCISETRPTRNFNADTAEPLSYVFVGVFPIALVTSFANPGELTVADLS